VSFYRVKGHVSVEKSTDAALRKLYDKFVEWNGESFTYDDFLYVTDRNNRADELANLGIDQVRD
jgi:ribonuclease HI